MKKLIIILIWLNLFFVLLFCACNRSEESIEPKPPIEQTNDPSSNSNLKNPSTTSVVVTNGGDSDVVKEKYNFRYKFQTGDIFRWNVVQQLKVDTTIKGSNEIVETYSKSAKVWRVLEVDANNVAKFEYWIDGVDTRKIQTGQELAEYNSSRDKTIPKEFRALEGTIGVSLAHFMIDVQGEIRRKIPLRIYSDESKENRIVIFFPSESLSVGDSWTVNLPPLDVQLNSDSDKVKKVSAKQRYVFESIHTGAAKIKFDTQILTPIDPSIQAKVLEYYVSGELIFDIDVGRIISQKITIDKTVVGFVDRNDSLHYISRLTECSCGLRSCEICSSVDKNSNQNNNSNNSNKK